LSELEELFYQHITMTGIICEREYKFARDAIGNPTKKIRALLSFAGLKDWRFDFAIPSQKIAIEIEGGIFTGGRHVQGVGFEKDCEKYNCALLLGWRVLRFSSNHVKSGRALELTEKLLKGVQNGNIGRVGANSERRTEKQEPLQFSEWG
jgi:hypothetical protein